MADLIPHHIPHDYKYQSQGDLENTPEYKEVKSYHDPDDLTRKESVYSDKASTLVGSSKRSSFFSEKPTKLDDCIPQKPKKRRRLWPWLILIIIALVFIALLAAFLVKRHDSAAGGVSGNFTSNSSQPAAIQGFDTWEFYNGDIMLVYESQGSIWTKQYQGSWNNPSLIASDAKPGTNVRLWGWVETGYDDDFGDSEFYNATVAYGLTYWTIYYVDTNNILQEMVMNLDSAGWTRDYNEALPPMSGSWYAGVLGSSGYEWEVSDTLYFEACSWGPLVQSESLAAGYLYFDAAGGGIKKIGTIFSSWWAIADLPDPVAGSSKAITCAGKGDQIENLWLINQNGQLEQWWLNATTAGYDDSPLFWNQGIQYSGLIDTNTSLETWSTPLTDIIFYQAPNNSIMYFNVLGEGNDSSISSSGSIGGADLGTHMSTSLGATTSPSLANYQNATFDAFYIYFQNGTNLTKEKMVPDPKTGVTVVSALEAQIVISAGVTWLGSSGGSTMIVLSLIVTLWLLL